MTEPPEPERITVRWAVCVALLLVLAVFLLAQADRLA